MNIEKAFVKLTGDTDNRNIGKIKGTTKSEVKKLCGKDWNEKAWQRMTRTSRKSKNRITEELPFFDKEQKLWFWF